MTELNLKRRTFLTGAAAAVGVTAAALATSQGWADEEVADLEVETVELVNPPFLPKHEQIARGAPKVKKFRMEVHEKKLVIDDEGTTVAAMTYNGTNPGPMLVVHQDDYVELTLVNPETNTLPHNIDFHASTGGLGGGALTLINPGEQTVLRFKATRAGVFVYHCAPGGPMIPWHVVSGMNGAILVLPRDGLKDPEGRPVHYDRAYYVGEQDFYIPRDADGNYKTYETPGDDYEDMIAVMRTLTPSHVVFNGAVGALAGDNALKANVGETVLILHSQANRDTRPHLIGGHGDLVWETGSFNNPPLRDQETWFIRGGSAGAALYTFRQPGTYAYVNHNLIEAVLLGALAQFKVEGKWNDDLMKQVAAPAPIV